jgi:hypothetical protein
MRRSNKQRPLSVKQVALGLPKRAWRTIMWREGASSPLTARFARVREPRIVITISPPAGRKNHANYIQRS